MIVLVHDLENSIQGVVTDETSRLAEQAWQDAQADLAAQVSDGILIVARGSGHMITLDKPETVVDALRTIVGKVGGK
jgi:pimeloyl-ACP methyl ester carboxylesterase